MVIIFLNINKLFIKVLLLELSLLLTLMCMKRVLVDPNTIFLATGFTQKNPRKLRFYVFLQFMLENIRYYFT